MKSIIRIIALTFIIGCKTSGYIYQPSVDSTFSINECGYFGNSKLTYESFDKGNEFSFIGYYAVNNYGDRSLLKVKECIEYYPNGKLKSRGVYQIGSYTQCCTIGPCEKYYNYKVGEWNYFYPNEQLKAKCEYESNIFHIQTSCQGGDSLIFNTIKSIEAFDELGVSVQPTDELLNELNTVLVEQYYYKIDPSNGKRIIMETEL